MIWRSLFMRTVASLIGISLASAVKASDPQSFSEEIEVRGPLRVYVTQVPELLDSSEESPYGKLLAELTRGFRKDLTLQIMPYRRAVRSFLDDNQSCLYIANESFDYTAFGSPDLSGVRYSKPLNLLRIKFYVREGRPAPGTMEALRGLTVAAEPGAYSVSQGDPEVKGRARMMQVENLQAALGLLAKGRVDAVASYSLDFAQYELSHGPQAAVAHEGFGIADISEQLACWDGGSRSELLDLVDSEIVKAIEDGRWRAILGKGAEISR